MALFQKDTTASKTNTQTRQGALDGPAMPSASASQRPAVKTAEPVTAPSESRLTVGPNIKLKGVEIEDCDTLVVEGYVEASMRSRVIEIAESGVYKGTVEIDTAVVRGRFEGELVVRDRLTVHEGGDVRGKIRYGRLAIEDGGRVHGDLDELADGGKPPVKPVPPVDPDPVPDAAA